MEGRNRDLSDSGSAMWRLEHFIERLVRGIAISIALAIKALDNWRRRQALARQLHRLDDCQLDDIGLTREQIALVVRANPEASELLAGMLKRLAIETTMANYHDLQRACNTCFVRAQCRRWLRRPIPADAWRTFCPNAPTLFRFTEASTAGT